VRDRLRPVSRSTPHRRRGRGSRHPSCAARPDGIASELSKSIQQLQPRVTIDQKRQPEKGCRQSDNRSARHALITIRQRSSRAQHRPGHRLGAQAWIEADQADSLMHCNGKQVGVGDLAVMEKQLRLQHGVDRPLEEVRPEQVSWLGEHSLKQRHHRGRTNGAVVVARVAEDAEARGAHAGDPARQSAPSHRAGQWAPPSALIIAQLIDQVFCLSRLVSSR
jgi:hypothetical protein